MSGAAETPTQEQLENLFVNNAGLQTVETFLNRFNPIRIMRMERMEIRHSAILAWLLDPQESHGLDDKFLRAFLGEALRGQRSMGFPTALDIVQSDLRDVIVRREWQNIDLFVHSPRLGSAFVIENKFDSQQHDGQLSKYIAKVRSLFNKDEGTLEVRGIFLTLYDEEPQDAAYAPIGYDAIHEILPSLLKQEAHLLTNEVATFLKHYIEILEDALDVSEEHKTMEKLARQLYREHSKALRFIMEHGETTNFEFAAQSLVGEEPDEKVPVEIDGQQYHFDYMDSSYISFLPASWYQGFGGDKFEWQGCDDWWMNFPMIAWVELRRDADDSGGQLRLYAEVGPLTEHELRGQLIHSIQQTADDAGSKRIRFQRGAADEGKKYSKFLKDNTINIQDVQNADEIALKFKKLLKRLQPEFALIGAILPQFQKFGKSA